MLFRSRSRLHLLLAVWRRWLFTAFSSSTSLVALYTTRYLPVLMLLFYLLEMDPEQPAHLFRTMAQQGEWTPTTVYGWPVSGIRCMLSHSSCPLPLAVMALTSYKLTTSTFIASNRSQVFISTMFHVTFLTNSLCIL